MKAYAYLKNDDEESVDPHELRDATLLLTLNDLDTVIEFLQEVKVKFQSCKLTPGESHLHLRDLCKQKWTPSDVDLIIVYNEL